MSTDLNIEYQEVKFGDICREVKLTTKDPIADGYDKYIGLEHLDSGSLKIKRWGLIAEDNPTFTRVFKKGHILIGKRRPYLKKAAIAEFDGICSGDIIVVEPTKNNEFLGKFLPFIIQSEKFWDHAIKTSSGSLSPRTKFSSLSAFTFMREDDNKLKARLLLLNKITENLNFCQSAKLAIENIESVLENNFFDECQHFLTLKEFTNKNGLQTGPFGSQLHASEYCSEGVAVIMPKELGYGKINIIESSKISTKRSEDLSSHKLIEGDFIFGRRGDIGRFGYISNEYEGSICGTGCIRFRPKDKNLSEFFKAYLRSRKAINWLNKNAVGMTMLNLNTKILSDLPVPLLKEEDYLKISKLCNRLDKLKSIFDRKNENLISLLNKVING